MKHFLYTRLVKPILFRMDPERVHDFFISTGAFAGRFGFLRSLTGFLFDYHHETLEQEICSMKFRNPVGLSAGFDKNGRLTRLMPHVGFGYMQVGTVTAEAYEGNPKPRLYRLPKSQGIVVYYGLKNIGIKRIVQHLNRPQMLPARFPVSFSIGKTNCSRTASDAAGIDDYLVSLEALIEAGLGDFYTLNVSCPNTFGGEPFTEAKKLNALLNAVNGLRLEKPLFLKMPVDLSWAAFKKLLDVAVSHQVDGVIIANLTKDREAETIRDEIPNHVKGGISGKPTSGLSNDLIEQTYLYYGDRLKIVGVGGVFSVEDAYAKIKKGASLVQVITGMIYEGPQLIGEINRGLVQLLREDGYENISQAVGADVSDLIS